LKDVQATGEVFIPQKRTSSTSEIEIFLLLWVIFAPSIRIQFSITTADPDPADQNERIYADPDPQHWFKVIEVMTSLNRDTMAKDCRGIFN
jgi:hypothetical protein